ncbi:GGDEF domain-containing protein [Amycolatopsis antarctica]|uniref:GGDEF domain-containing protein n=1 Tax=Amycolatopsis antarctica TaxID=1854586 RepID=A0A263D3J9_9PSEU|nr:GGDEF domain-containing protein [Amycolatopsis antarctica]OZM72658.1 GGDEF domain-containing protein [Amycolatopsis antarctica]
MSAELWITVVTAAGWLAASGTARYWWHRALFDELTGLPGRARLNTAARRAARRGARVGVLLLDVDRFKAINDTHGHRAGDALLTVIATRLNAATGRGEVAIRLHGDEFAVWLAATTPTAAARRAREVSAALARPVVVEGRELTVTASVGHATGRARDLAGLLHAADQSMYATKRDRTAIATLPGGPGQTRLRDARKDVA